MTTDYLIEMKLAPTSTIPTPAEGVVFTERFVLPTLENCERLVGEGRIVAGGPVLGTMTFSFVARTASAVELEHLVTSLPLWPRAHTVVVPLGTFAERLATVRKRLATAKAGAADVGAPPSRNV